MATTTEGGDLLAGLLDNNPALFREISWTMQVSDQTIWAWRTGRRKPEPPYREALELLCGIPQTAWLDNLQREILVRVRLYIEQKAAGNSPALSLPETGTGG